MEEFPHGMNWQCSLCGTFASVADADLGNYKCPECQGMGLKSFSKKAVAVPKVEFSRGDIPLKFQDERFMAVGVKKSGSKKKRSSLKGKGEKKEKIE